MTRYIAVLSLFLAATTAQAADLASMLTQLDTCRNHAEAAKRLACYDALLPPAVSAEKVNQQTAAALTVPAATMVADPVDVQPTVAPAAVPAPVAPDVKATDHVAEFGAEAVRKPEADEEQLNSLTDTIDALKKDPYGKYVVTLKNGQVWKQMETGRIRLSNGDSVTIRRGVLGSYLMTKAGSKSSVRVKRAR